MPKEAMFSMKLEEELRAAFMAEASATHRPASQIVRDMMRDFVKRQQDARKYEDFLQQKVKAARVSLKADKGRTHDDMEAEFAARREALLGAKA